MSWQHQAACRYEDPELFFPVGSAGPAQLQGRKARRICAGCPVRVACLRHAIEADESAGIWGGADEGERRALKRRADRERAAALRVRAGAARGGEDGTS